MDAKPWCDAVAELAADALVDGRSIKKDDVRRAVEIISEEKEMRLILGDYPPAAPDGAKQPQ